MTLRVGCWCSLYKVPLWFDRCEVCAAENFFSNPAVFRHVFAGQIKWNRQLSEMNGRPLHIRQQQFQKESHYRNMLKDQIAENKKRKVKDDLIISLLETSGNSLTE